MEGWYRQQMRRAAEFEQQAVSVWNGIHLHRAYTLQEVMNACQRVCSHYPHSAHDTMGVLLIGDSTVMRDFIQELAKEQG